MSKSILLISSLIAVAVTGLLVVKVESAPSGWSATVPTQPQTLSSVRKLNLLANDLLTDPGSSQIFATVPSKVGPGGNSITPIDTVAGTTGQPIPIGSEPGKMAISDDGAFVYVILTGAERFAGSMWRLKRLDHNSPSVTFPTVRRSSRTTLLWRQVIRTPLLCSESQVFSMVTSPCLTMVSCGQPLLLLLKLLECSLAQRLHGCTLCSLSHSRSSHQIKCQ